MSDAKVLHRWLNREIRSSEDPAISYVYHDGEKRHGLGSIGSELVDEILRLAAENKSLRSSLETEGVEP